MTTYFEGRELTSYAEPITSDELREGEVYFFVNYVDEALLIPTITTVVSLAGTSRKVTRTRSISRTSSPT